MPSTKPFEQEQDPDLVVLADCSLGSPLKPIESMEECKRALAKLNPENLLRLLSVMHSLPEDKKPSA
jgi:hypothetical protein